MSIFSDNNIFSTKHTTENTEFYTISGEEDHINDGTPMRKNDDDKVYAKKVQRSDSSLKYLIRLDPSAKLFNPLSIYDQTDKRQVTEFLNTVCRTNKRFREVNHKTFELYLKFLSTKNTSWLHNAEREIL